MLSRTQVRTIHNVVVLEINTHLGQQLSVQGGDLVRHQGITQTLEILEPVSSSPKLAENVASHVLSFFFRSWRLTLTLIVPSLALSQF